MLLTETHTNQHKIWFLDSGRNNCKNHIFGNLTEKKHFVCDIFLTFVRESKNEWNFFFNDSNTKSRWLPRLLWRVRFIHQALNYYFSAKTKFFVSLPFLVFFNGFLTMYRVIQSFSCSNEFLSFDNARGNKNWQVNFFYSFSYYW